MMNNDPILKIINILEKLDEVKHTPGKRYIPGDLYNLIYDHSLIEKSELYLRIESLENKIGELEKQINNKNNI